MPLYDYHCGKCGTKQERFYPMSNYPSRIKCSCGSMAHKLCNAGGFQESYSRSGGIQDDHPVWLDKSIEYLQTEKEARLHPIESRSDMYRYMKKNKIRFAHEGNGAKPPEDKPISPEARKRGIEAVAKAGHEARSFSVNL